MTHKKIDINQRIPLHVLHVALETHLRGSYSEDYIMEQLKLDFNGVNRLKKSLRIVNNILHRNELLPIIESHRAEILQAIKKRHDRNLILIALLNSAYVFSFDTLQLLGKYLSVQELVNRDTIRKALSNVYGGNRSTENAIDSVIPMFIEAGIIKRDKIGVYCKNTDFQVASAISRQVFLESYKIKTSSPFIQSHQQREPYFALITNFSVS